jgi:preprotein translocase subunit YajC
MTGKLKKGDKVAWGTTQGETHGTVEKIVTETTKVKGYTAKATKAEPQVLVKSDKTGKEAVHKPGSVHKA